MTVMSMDTTHFADAAFWRSLAPDWGVGEDNVGCDHQGPLIATSSAEQAERLLLMRREGYLHGQTRWDVEPLAMADLVRRLDQRGIPPIFALVYDPYWVPFFQLHHVIAGLLGGDYHMLPAVWIWNIDPSRQQSGWPPHRDRGHHSLNPDGSPKSITVWLPLSTATPMSSCIYILPADCDPTYGTASDAQFTIDLTMIRALPAVPGDYLIWNQAVLHWGSRASARAPHSRVSIACEFERAGGNASKASCLPPRFKPSFNDRLRLIARQIIQYNKPGFAHIDTGILEWAQQANAWDVDHLSSHS